MSVKAKNRLNQFHCFCQFLLTKCPLRTSHLTGTKKYKNSTLYFKSLLNKRNNNCGIWPITRFEKLISLELPSDELGESEISFSSNLIRLTYFPLGGIYYFLSGNWCPETSTNEKM